MHLGCPICRFHFAKQERQGEPQRRVWPFGRANVAGQRLNDALQIMAGRVIAKYVKPVHGTFPFYLVFLVQDVLDAVASRMAFALPRV